MKICISTHLKLEGEINLVVEKSFKNIKIDKSQGWRGFLYIHSTCLGLMVVAYHPSYLRLPVVVRVPQFTNLGSRYVLVKSMRVNTRKVFYLHKHWQL